MIFYAILRRHVFNNCCKRIRSELIICGMCQTQIFPVGFKCIRQEHDVLLDKVRRSLYAELIPRRYFLFFHFIMGHIM